MKIAMIRVGVDAGATAGGIQGPLFGDGSFEFIPIPENPYAAVVPKYTYGNLIGRHKKPLMNYFPDKRRVQMAECGVHNDPDWETFTYGSDTCGAQAGLQHLAKGDILIFTCGLQGYNIKTKPGIYLAGYFKVVIAGTLSNLIKRSTQREVKKLFGQNAHVRGLPLGRLVDEWGDELILVKGSRQSRLLKKAVLLSITRKDSIGRPLKVLSPEMQKIFGDFDGKTAIQRSPTRWVAPDYVEQASKFLYSQR
jgi:hypothetical protein